MTNQNSVPTDQLERLSKAEAEFQNALTADGEITPLDAGALADRMERSLEALQLVTQFIDRLGKTEYMLRSRLYGHRGNPKEKGEAPHVAELLGQWLRAADDDTAKGMKSFEACLDHLAGRLHNLASVQHDASKALLSKLNESVVPLDEWRKQQKGIRYLFGPPRWVALWRAYLKAEVDAIRHLDFTQFYQGQIRTRLEG